MSRSPIALIGLTAAILFVLHAAMLAGGAHAPAASAHPHRAMSMESLAVSERQPNAPAVESPEMVECTLLGTAVVRFQFLLGGVPSTISLILQTAASTATPREYAPVVAGLCRAQLQVFLI